MTSYHAKLGGHPPPTNLMTQRAAFTEAYALIPGGTVRDITASRLPGWRDTWIWIIARPMTGFSESFCQLLLHVLPGGGTEAPEPDPRAEAALFVTEGRLTLTIEGKAHEIGPGDFAWLPPGCRWTLLSGPEGGKLHWIRKAYEPAPGVAVPAAFVVNEATIPVDWMPGTDETWGTTRFVDPADLGHDMHLTIVTLEEPGGSIPFEETHVMEHGLYVLEGKGVYKLNTDWVEVEAGDFMWLRAFCPQAAYAGPGNFRYLLYKDVNRHPKLW